MEEEFKTTPVPAPESSEPREEEKIVHQIERRQKEWKPAVLAASIILVIVAGGAMTGFFLSRQKGEPGTVSTQNIDGAIIVSGKKEVGIKDEEVFRDHAQGRIEANDFSQVEEGSHRLMRLGGESQTAYLTSSVVDLDQFVGKCVEVWGETFAGQSAGWLMDVGRVKILDRCPEGV